MKRLINIWPLLTALLLALIFSTNTPVKAVEDDPTAAVKKYNITFPITELGSCQDYATCKSYCEDPIHQDACIAFAKIKGFYKEDAAVLKAKTLFEAAKVELGCDSFDSCKSLCSNSTNQDKCDGFAKLHNLNGGVTKNPGSENIVQKAKEVLGCDSESTCKTFCAIASNQQRCAEFAKQVGLRGGEVRKGPGGCSSDETCRTFCSEPANFNECSQFGSSRGQGQFRGPGGCNSKESCESYCKDHQSECSQVTRSQTAPVDNKEFVDFCKTSPDKCFYDKYCRENPDKCQKDFTRQGLDQPRPDMGNCKTPGECYDWCKANPGKCQGFNADAPRPDDSQYKQYTQSNYDPAAACKRGGCSWTNGSCQCSGSGYNYQSAYQNQNYGSTMSREQQESTCRAGGGTCDWRSDTCYCQGYRSSGYSSGYSSAPTYSSTNNYSSGSSMTREQQDATCRSGGGTCDWTTGICNCQGYHSPTSGSTTTTTNTSTTTNTTPTSAPAGMTRESQEAGCRACNGSCNWSGDFCSCQCGSTTTQQSSQPTNAPVASPELDAGTQCTQSGGRWAGGQCYHDTVQGVSKVASFWDWLLNLFR